MNCGYCGNNTDSNEMYCQNCGCDPKKGTTNCINCGEIKKNIDQIVCLKCGSPFKSQTNSNQDKTDATIAYITIIGFIIALKRHQNTKSKFVAYHLRQVLGLFLTNFLAFVVCLILSGPALDGRASVVEFAIFVWSIFLIFQGLLSVFRILGIINAINGIEKPMPIVGVYFEKKLSTMFEEEFSWELFLNNSKEIVLDFVKKKLSELKGIFKKN
jgi:hypothetical protein